MKPKMSSLVSKNELEKLINRGVDITHGSQEGDILYSENPVDSMHQVFSDYQIWKDDVRLFFIRNGLDNEASVFFEADDVPLLKGGLAYSFIQSEQSQTLLKNIRKETKIKLDFLRHFLTTLPIELPKVQVSFDEAKSVLKAGEKVVKIKKFSYPFHYLRIVFNEPKRFHDVWFFSEISEKYDPEEKHNDKKFYNAVYQLDQKLQKLQIKDFFLNRTAQSLQINPRYFI